MHKRISGIICFIMLSSFQFAKAGIQEAMNYFEQKNYTAAYQEAKILVNQGDLTALYIMGCMEMEGLGIPKDVVNGSKLLQQAIEGGFVPAMAYYGVYLMNDTSKQENAIQAYIMLSLAAELGQPTEELNYLSQFISEEGKQLARGAIEAWKTEHGINELSKARQAMNGGNYETAMRLLESCPDTSLEKHYLMGVLYMNGWGVPPNLAKAVEHLSKSANNGYILAMVTYGDLMVQSAESIKDMNKELSFKQFMLGIAYLDKAARLGDGAAVDRLKQYASQIPDELWTQIREIEDKTIVGTASNISNPDYTKSKFDTGISEKEKQEKLNLAVNLKIKALELYNHGKIKEAYDSISTALTLYEQTLSPDHIYTGAALSVLGTVQVSLQDYDAAISTCQRVVTIYEKNLGENDTAMPMIYNNLAAAYIGKGENLKARPYLEKALKILNDNNKTESIECGTILNSLGTLSLGIGDYSMGIDYLIKAGKILHKELEPDDPSLGTLHNNLGLAFRSIRNGEADAVPHYEQALSIYKKRDPEGSADIANVLMGLGLCHMELGQPQLARQEFDTALIMTKKYIGTNNNQLAAVYEALATLCQEQNDLFNAQRFQEEAIQIRLNIFGEDHQNTASAYDKMASIRKDKLDKHDAASYALKSARIMKDYLRFNITSLSYNEATAFMIEVLPEQTNHLLDYCLKSDSLGAAYSQLLYLKGLVQLPLRRQSAISSLSGNSYYSSTVAELEQIRLDISAWYQKINTISYKDWAKVNSSLTTRKEELERSLLSALPEGALIDPMDNINAKKFADYLHDDELFADVYSYSIFSKRSDSMKIR